MFLKSIELFGFKSFADKSKIDFSPGISALLGPNGCGKSNIVDAVKWVLGEQATKTLRADRMEDIIFNGTEARKALNVAEVTMVMSNEEGILPLDVPEIVVKRRLFRSGDSEYSINNTPVRLKEIRELFFDTGIGKTAYSIMEQGKIDQILSNKPEERRVIFEEAAAITKYKIKSQEAERKLDRTEDNIRQVNGILGEVERSYNSLKIQSEKTLRHRQLREDAFILERDLQLLKLKGFLENKERKSADLEKKIRDRTDVKEQIDTINENLEENLDIVNSMENKLIESQKNLYGIELKRNGQENQINILAERRSEVEGVIAADQVKQKNIRLKIESIKNALAGVEREKAEQEKQVQEIDTNISEFENSIKQASDRIIRNNNLIREKEGDIRRAEGEQEELQNDLRLLTDDIVEQLDNRLKESGYSARERVKLETEIEQTVEGAMIIIKGRKDRLEDLKAAGSAGITVESLITETASSLETALTEIGKLPGILDSYRSLTPAFLDEFLAPQGIITRKRSIDDKLNASRHLVKNRREEITAFNEENSHLSKKIDEYRRTLEELKVGKARIKTRIDGFTETMARNQREIGEQEHLLRENEKEISASRKRMDELSTRIKELELEKKDLTEKEKVLRNELSSLEKGISKRNKDLMTEEKRVKSLMDQLGRFQGEVEKLQMELTEITTEIRNIYSNFQERHSRDLSEFEDRIFEITASARDLRDQLQKNNEEQRSLGHINLMAPEEFAEVKERYEFLNNQLEDLEKAKKDLFRVTEEIRTESSQMFIATYEKIKKNFHVLFRRLFGGGRAEVKLVDPANVLESGIEIYVQPPGKKLENIALLSGGERSLTAVALLFATYMVKPSPFCLLDEIDAALDENNVGRFTSMLMEFGQRSQFIIITHNKKTVTCADTLLGVTMEESGVSKLIAIRLDKAVEKTYA